MKIIPINASAGITGFASPGEQYKQLSLTLDALLIKHPSATYFCKVEGESMVGDGVFPSDILLVDRALPITNLCLVVASLNGEFVLKRIDLVNRRLLSSNSNNAPIYLTDADDLTIEGRVPVSLRLHDFINLDLVS